MKDDYGPLFHVLPYGLEVIQKYTLKFLGALDVDGILDVACIVLIVVPCVNYYVWMALAHD